MNVHGEKVAVVGMGRTAMALVRLLLREGAEPIVTERDDGPRLDPYRSELEALGVPYECGGHKPAAFDGAAWIIPSPGVSPDIEPIARSRAVGAKVVGEMEFAFAYCRSPILAVTGTNGKTTTTELVKTLLASCGRRVLLAGNTDTPFSAAVLADPAPEFIVLEVSSYQLETARRFRPWIAAVLNISPDHLARHRTVEQYVAVKARLFANQRAGDVAVVNYDDPRVQAMTPAPAAALWPFSLEARLDSGLWVNGSHICLRDEPVASVSDTTLPGRHNLQNVLAALTIMRAGGFNWEDTIAGLRSFKGVEHRIEHVAQVRGVEFFNDSKSTNIESLKVALESFDAPVVLVVGGRGKGADYRVLRDLVKQRMKHIVTLGEDAALLEAAFGDLVAAERAKDMDEAVERAAAAATPSDVVLLSPACASFDMYENFEHRGRAFKESVYKYRQRVESCGGKQRSS